MTLDGVQAACRALLQLAEKQSSHESCESWGRGVAIW